MIRESAIKFYSVGIVAFTKVQGDPMIQVTPIEDLSQLTGKLQEAKMSYSTSMPDHQGVVRQGTLEGGATMSAQWINLGESNRTTAPDVYASETVLLLKVADNEQIYWTDMLNETALRRLETVRYSYSNKSSGIEPYDGDSSYWLEFDTRGKQVRFHTSDNDGEYTTYDIDLQTRDGNLTIKDGFGNTIYLDSKANHLEVTTLQSMKFVTKQWEVDADDVLFNAAKTFKVLSPDSTIQGDSIKLVGGTVTLTGTITTDGPTNMSGDIALQGGNISLNGDSVTCGDDDLKIDK